jgi:hypothetical protein
MPQTIDLINFPFGPDVSQWPKLTCTQPGQLDLQDAGLRLPDSRDILFQNHGQIRSGDDMHRLVFDRAGGLLELHEAGAIRLLTGSPTPTERLRILATGQVGIGTTSPGAQLVVNDVTAAELRVDGNSGVVGLTVGADSNHPWIGSRTNHGLRILTNGTEKLRVLADGKVGLGTATPTHPLDIKGAVRLRAATHTNLLITQPDNFNDNIALDFIKDANLTPSARILFDGFTDQAVHRASLSFFTRGAATTDMVERVRITEDGNIGIGTTAPTQMLEVMGTVKATAFQGNGAGLTGVGGIDDTKVAKRGDTMSGPLSITAAGTALRVNNIAEVGRLIVGGSTAATRGGMLEVLSLNSTAVAAICLSDGSDERSDFGVYAEGLDAIRAVGRDTGIWAEGQRIGIYATGRYRAAYFVGNVDIGGTLSKGGGGFKIDHPLDPANQYLSHSFVESPEMLNIYNGTITTNAHGEATVVLPEYFETLNRDFRYQLTPIGQMAQAAVTGEIRDNRFTIQTDKPGVTVSWQVTGVRQDPWANAHRIAVEEAKPPAERGFYLYPEVHRQPATKSILVAQYGKKSMAPPRT